MNLDPGSREWNENIVRLYRVAGRAEFPALLAECLAGVLALDSFLVFSYRGEDRPELLYARLHSGRRRDVRFYLEGAYLLDPFYRLFLEGACSGVYPLAAVAPDHFTQSDYFRSYYKYADLDDEVNIFINAEPAGLIALALGRARGKPAFSQQERTLLENMEPVLSELCRRHWAGPGAGMETAAGQDANRRFLRGMSRFASSVLSVKEREVMQLLLMGHSVKSTAARMGISPGTVKIHRNNIYAKLDIGSQTELFSLFIGAMSTMPGDGDEDPLLAYQARPETS
ncbi:helix-turn-helix transcriptional regulator [Luteithermobacter gelatinilyticus]|uniref:helix-turn-helix transcriptional regulator n=1 Tax=Luteithermobacter gelatinilyticus TaxID=2582913 RepID=UPI0011059A56|nr:helix-turn-helix transcriptional regulator [Luteithermobacter gelatinilyticus]